MSDIPFPEGPQDGDIFFHLDKVCLYHGDSQTWECRNRADLEDPEVKETIYTTDVYVPETSRADFQHKSMLWVLVIQYPTLSRRRTLTKH